MLKVCKPNRVLVEYKAETIHLSKVSRLRRNLVDSSRNKVVQAVIAWPELPQVVHLLELGVSRMAKPRVQLLTSNNCSRLMELRLYLQGSSTAVLVANNKIRTIYKKTILREHVSFSENIFNLTSSAFCKK